MTALITVPELAAWLADPDRASRLVVLDVQFRLSHPRLPDGPTGRQLYAESHLPGARFVDLDTALADPPGLRGRHPLPDMARLQDALRALGLDDDSPVVAYDEGNGLGAARAWWVLSYAGLPAVRVLDGGLAAWRAAGHPVTAEVPAAAAQGTVTVRPGGMPVLDADAAAELAATGLLLDARAPERFAGQSEPIDPVAGHIPGAVNAPMGDYVAADGRFLGREDLHRYFTGRGVFAHSRVGAYCGSGVTAAHLALALREIGIPAAVYVGSWSEWVADPSRPVATGTGSGV